MKNSLPIFIHSAVDDHGLSASEFRVLAHIARRAGNGTCFAAVPKMAKTCKLHPQTIRQAITVLTSIGMVSVEHNPGKPSHYRITPVSKWQPYRKEYPTESNRGVSDSEGCLPKPIEGHPTERNIDEGNPIEGAPFKLIPEEAPAAEKKPKSLKQVTDDFLAELANDPAYVGLDVRHVYAKLCRWCTTNHKRPSRRRLVDWLNREEKPLAPHTATPDHSNGF